MTGLAFLIVAGGITLTQQAREAVAEGLWIDYRTLQVGVEWER